MRFIDWFLTIFIIACMILLVLISTMISSLTDVKKNWSKYRCNPSYMWLASYAGHDTTTNFGHCVGQMQKITMPKFTNPLHANNVMLNSNISMLSDTMNNIRKMQGNVRNAFGNNILNIFGIFNNIILVFQRFIISFRDILARIIAIVTVLLYSLQTQFMLGDSIVKGPIITSLKVLSMGAIQ
tara:strand:+ start:698 stop:1246 length:549 start_codon:yes stop_codon:yes gene_type:complete